jgi:hypothetical protein
MDRIEVPESIKKKMNMWRNGMFSIPQDYIDFQKKLAEKALAKLPVTVHRSYMADDGWMDGMKFLHAIVETSDEKLLKIKWGDDQYFKVRTPCGGWAIFKP